MKFVLRSLIWLWLWLVGLAGLGTGQTSGGPEEEEENAPAPALPAWEEEELEELEAGEYVPGSSLIGRLAQESLESNEEEVIELAEAVRALPKEVSTEEGDPVNIPEEFLPAYFEKAPEGFLNDPQNLLTSQEFRDREGFLAYHTRDVGIDFYLYLFDGKQQLPEGFDLASLVAGRFDPEEPAAVVFYFLESPERSQLVFTQRVIEAADPSKRREVLEEACEEAGQKSDAVSQLEVFSMEVSARLAWLEKEILEGGGNLFLEEAVVLLGDQGSLDRGKGLGWMGRLAQSETLFLAVVGTGLVMTAAILGFLGRWIADKRRTYLFPDAEGSPVLEAPYAAGVGGVLSFASSQTPPSRQKSDVPDYLQRM